MKIDITGIDMVKFVKAVYDLSNPQGMGFVHFTPEPLSDEEAKSLIKEDGTVSLDYVKGRACKMHVFKEDDKLYINDTWFDHTDKELEQLLMMCK